MKKFNHLILSFLTALFVFSACDNIPPPEYWAQTRETIVVFHENFGNQNPDSVAYPFPSIADYTGFQTTGFSAGSVRYSAEGTVTVRPDLSSDYPNASGASNAMLSPDGASFVINNISTCGARNLTLSFGSNQASDILSVSYQVFGADQWHMIDYRKATEEWGLVEDLIIILPLGTSAFNLRFTADPTYYGTRIDDIKIVTRDPIIPCEPERGGAGTVEDPFTVAQAIASQRNVTAWVKGYIVGSVRQGVSSVTSADDVFIGVPTGWNALTNVLIADSPDETDFRRCIVVNLPVGTPLRTEVNLVNNPENFRQTLAAVGVLRAYFGLPGLRDSDGSNESFVLGGITEPREDILNETLLTQESFNRFLIRSNLGNQVWTFDSRFGAVMSGFAGGTTHANEVSFISPAMDLRGKSNVVLTFEHSRGPASQMHVSTENLTLWISNNFYVGGGESNWLRLPIPTHGTTAWQFVSSGEIAFPADMMTENVRFRFRYICNDVESATWQIRNVVVR